MILSPAERRLIILQSINHQGEINNIRLEGRKNAEKVARIEKEREDTKQKRLSAMFTHEEENKALGLIKQKEIDARLEFIKALNVL